MPIEYFPPMTAQDRRPRLPSEPIGTWAAMWLDALWSQHRSRYEAMSPSELTAAATEKENAASLSMMHLLATLEKQHFPIPANPADAMAWRAPLVNQAREMVYHDLLSDLRSVNDAPG